MSKLTAASRNSLPDSAFAVSGRRYPIHDENHARDALARASGKPEEAEVRAAVHRRYPNIGQEHNRKTRDLLRRAHAGTK